VHPFERLRYVARAGVDDPALTASEASAGLAALGRQPEALVTACRRLLDFHPECGPLWWMAARILTSGDPAAEARCCALDLEDDTTPFSLADGLVAAGAPARVTVLLPAELATSGLALMPARAVNALVPYMSMSLAMFAGEMEDAVDDLTYHDLSDIEPALDGAGLALIEPVAAGPAGVMVRAVGSWSAAEELVALATERDVPVWAVCGVGRVLPAPLFGELRDRLERRAEPAAAAAAAARRGRSRPGQATFLPAEAFAQVVRPDGVHDTGLALRQPDCPAPDELLVRAR
jgi:hypothetical protein